MFEDSIEIAPEFARSHLYLSRVLWTLRGRSQESDPEQMLSSAERAVELEPEFGPGVMWLGMLKGMPDWATLGKRALDLAPSDSWVNFQYGRVLERLGDSRGAAEARKAYEARLREKRGGP